MNCGHILVIVVDRYRLGVIKRQRNSLPYHLYFVKVSWKQSRHSLPCLVGYVGGHVHIFASLKLWTRSVFMFSTVHL